MKVASVTSRDIDAFIRAMTEGKTAARAKTGKVRGVSHVRGGRGAATRTAGLLGAVFSYAVRHRMRADNPVVGVTRSADGRRERRLNDDEYATFGAALGQAADVQMWPAAIAAAQFLALTGWRSGEALTLRWKDVDLARRTAILPDTKSGRSLRPLANAACDVLRTLGRDADGADRGPDVGPRYCGPVFDFAEVKRVWKQPSLERGELIRWVTAEAHRYLRRTGKPVPRFYLIDQCIAAKACTNCEAAAAVLCVPAELRQTRGRPPGAKAAT